MAVSSKYTQYLCVQIVFFTFSCKWFLCFNFWAVIWSYIVDLFAALHELASASARTLLKLASSVRALLKPYGDTLNVKLPPFSLIRDFGKQNVSKISVSLACYRHITRGNVSKISVSLALSTTKTVVIVFFFFFFYTSAGLSISDRNPPITAR